MKTLVVATFFTLYSLSCSALDLNSMMSEEEKHKTGYESLTKQEKKELNQWLTKRVIPIQKNPNLEPLSLNINSQSGKELLLSDGSKWEVSPEDQKISSIWLTPIPLELLPSDSKEFPYFLINLDVKTEKVKVRPIS